MSWSIPGVLVPTSLASLSYRAALWAIRTALLSLVLFVLLDPRLVVETDQPIRGHVTVLLDDSLSMRIRDMQGTARSDFVERAFVPGVGSVATTLEQRDPARIGRRCGIWECAAPRPGSPPAAGS